MVVLVTDTTAIPAVASAFDDAVRRSPEWSDLDLFRNLPLSFRGARRGWAKLYRWRRAFDDRMPAAMTYSDIDERSNRIEVGIDDVTATAAVRALSEDIGIPEAAFLVQPSARARPQPRLRGPWVDSLIGYRRPPLAGMQVELAYRKIINGVPASVTGFCTLGANVVLVGSPDPLFLTNSHCTQSLFEVDSLGGNPRWYQPSNLPPGRSYPDTLPPIAIGDHTDPGLFAGGACPAGKLCRWSDAALVKYLDGSNWLGGWIAYPMETAPWPFEFGLALEIGLGVPTPPGNQIYNVAAKTGFKIGQRDLGRTCATVPLGAGYDDPPPPNAVLLCQSYINHMPNGTGDSGGPVFMWVGFLPAQVKFMGLHWGADGPSPTVFSPVSGIKNDLGTLKYHLH